jgi:hypothetical protein
MVPKSQAGIWQLDISVNVIEMFHRPCFRDYNNSPPFIDLPPLST